MAEAYIKPSQSSQTNVDLRLTKTMSFKLEQLGTCKHYNKEDVNRENRSFVACVQKKVSEFLISRMKANCTSLLYETLLPKRETGLPYCASKEEMVILWHMITKSKQAEVRPDGCLQECVRSFYQARVSYLQVSQ